ncbi:MAG: Spy/CpxP family protein refolding chaperone [Candidatus Omnitrophota bacterium]
MRQRLTSAVFSILVLVLAVSVSIAYAYDSGKSRSRGYGSKSYSTEDKILQKAHFLMEKKEELGLSDEQVAKIKDLKLNAKKESIKKTAEIEIIALDIEAAMRQDAVDAGAIGALIDKKYEIKKAKAKSMVKAYAELKGVLTAEQMGKLKELYKSCKKGSKK